ncbi:TIGR03643 family protein [Marinobacterium weihaiense]|uniref:TIGR03643 family protein n=1 Tax=Marinobacterium weihaiense TaxID=2851016 RepID=A0ABS6MGC2_9GAMM|nr:TIGR03643 family protein [Marinobacterium weihaiense]MBV0934856.1 TIGR03643 family protein [Marinobacterium weihaiense]
MLLSSEDHSRIIEMAWEDRTPFEAIEHCYGLSEVGVIRLMRRSLKSSSFRMWRKRVSGRRNKHLQLRPAVVNRGFAPGQYKHR